MIPNAISVPLLPPKDEIGFRKQFGLKDRPFILFMGRLNLIKGPDLLLHAFCQLTESFPEIDLVFAGPDSGMLAELQSIVSKTKTEDRVHFLGYLDREEKYQAYQAATLLAIPSRQEAMSMVVLEAGIVGKASIFTDQCGLDELARTCSGWMVSPSIEGLKRGLMDILSSPAQIPVVSDNVKETIMMQFSWQATIPKYKQMYAEVMADFRPREL